MWIDPQDAGTYLGQCAEYCGTEHAMMLLRVVVEPRADFDRWVAAQQAARPRRERPRTAAQVFESNACINCHAVTAPRPTARFGPDLTHLMTRQTIGAGVAMNTPDHLKIWVNDPAQHEAGRTDARHEPRRQDLDDVVAYLVTLQVTRRDASWRAASTTNRAQPPTDLRSLPVLGQGPRMGRHRRSQTARPDVHRRRPVFLRGRGPAGGDDSPATRISQCRHRVARRSSTGS